MRKVCARAGSRIHTLRRTIESTERGATLFIMAAAILVVLLSASVAVDLSAKSRRAQELQNATDAASLAAAQVWNSGNETAARTVANQILQQNGIDTSQVAIDVDFPSNTSVTVSVRDDGFEGFFSPLTGGLSEINREATASYLGCSVGCDQTVIVPPIFRAIEARSTGDGFIPVEVGDRLFAINHHQNGVACVDRTTGDNCWTHDQAAFSGHGRLKTFDNHTTPLIGDKIYYIGSSIFTRKPNLTTEEVDTGFAVLGCFDTSINQICPTFKTITGEGQVALAEHDGLLYVFTGRRNVFCFDANFVSCPKYNGGRDAQIKEVATWDDTKAILNKSVTEVVGDRIFTTISQDRDHFVQCWDTGDDAPCDIGPWAAPPSLDDLRIQKVFLNRSAAGTPIDYCLLGEEVVKCWNLADGLPNIAAEAMLDALRVQMATTAPWATWQGKSSYHAEANTTFVVNARESWSYCWNHTTLSLCTPHYDSTALGEVETYGYIADGPSCLIGFGDESIFFSARIDLSGPCDTTGGETEIWPCQCLGEPVWPRIEPQDVEGVLSFEIRVTDPAGNIVRNWTDLLDNPIDLRGVPDHEHLKVEFNLRVQPGADPWLAGNPPTFNIIGEEVAPHLTS